MTAVIFDLDGTLVLLPVDIEPVRREVELLLAEAGAGAPARPLLGAIDRAAAAVGGESGAALRARARGLIDAAELAASAQARAMPGAVQAVEELAGRGFRLGIVTDNGRACLAPALAATGLERFAWHAVTRDEVRQPKPAPDGVLSAARALCPGGGAVWVIGDAPRDVLATRAAAAALGPDFHLQAVAVLGGRATADALREAGPDHVISALGELTALVAGQG